MTSPFDQFQTSLPADIEAVEAAMKEAVREALLRHKQAGNPIATWENGRVQWIAADKIDLAEFEPAMADGVALSQATS